MHVARTKVSPFSVTLAILPLELSWKEHPHQSWEPGQVVLPVVTARFAVDHTPGDSSNQSSGRDRSTDCWNVGFGPVPYEAYSTGRPSAPLFGVSVPRQTPPRLNSTLSPGFAGTSFALASVCHAVAGVRPSFASLPAALSKENVVA